MGIGEDFSEQEGGGRRWSVPKPTSNPGRLRRVTARPLKFVSIGVAERFGVP